MQDPAQSIKDLLVTAGVGVFATPTGWCISIGVFPDAPDTIILVNQVGGLSPMPHLLLNEPSLQIAIRGAKSGYVAARYKMKDVIDALLGMNTTVLQGDTYRSCIQLGDAAFVGQDDNTRPIITANFRFIVEPAASATTHRSPIT